MSSGFYFCFIMVHIFLSKTFENEADINLLHKLIEKEYWIREQIYFTKTSVTIHWKSSSKYLGNVSFRNIYSVRQTTVSYRGCTEAHILCTKTALCKSREIGSNNEVSCKIWSLKTYLKAATLFPRLKINSWLKMHNFKYIINYLTQKNITCFSCWKKLLVEFVACKYWANVLFHIIKM